MYSVIILSASNEIITLEASISCQFEKGCSSNHICDKKQDQKLCLFAQLIG